MGGYSGWAGGVALAIIAMPVIVRTTEDMLRLVPGAAARGRRGARRAAFGRDHAAITWRAARAGMVTGILLATGPHRRRDGAAALHRAQQQFLVPARPDGRRLEPAGDDLPVRALRPTRTGSELAWAGALIITVSILALSIVARLRRQEGQCAMSSVAVRRRAAAIGRIRPAPMPMRPIRIAVQQPRLLLRRLPRPEEHQPRFPRPAGHRADRPVRLRQVDPAAHLQPHLQPLSRAAGRRARSCSTAATSCRRPSTSTSCARGSAWCSRSRRPSRCRSTTTSPSASASTRSCRGPNSTSASRRRCARRRSGTRSRTSSGSRAWASRAASSSASASPARSRRSRR